MSEISEFVGAPKEIEIEGKKIKIYPLKVGDLQMFKKNLSEEEQMNLSIEMIKKSLNNPKVTEEEIKNMDMKYFVRLVDEITKLNGFEDDRIAKIKKQIARTGSQ